MTNKRKNEQIFSLYYSKYFRHGQYENMVIFKTHKPVCLALISPITIENLSDRISLFYGQKRINNACVLVKNTKLCRVFLNEFDFKFKKAYVKEYSFYEKKTFGQRLRTFAVLLMLGVFTGSGLGVWYFNENLRSNVDYNSIDPAPYYQNIGTVMARNFNISSSESMKDFVSVAASQNKSPLDLSPADNFALCEYKASLASSFIASGSGTITAMGISQPIRSCKMHKDNKYTFESLSTGIISVAFCDIYYDNDSTITIYKGSNIKNNTAEYNKDSVLSLTDYAALSGGMPQVIQPYIISDATIISSTEVVYDEESGLFTFSVQLHKIYSVLNYVRQMKRTGGLGSYPEFSSISQTYYIDKDWNLAKVEIQEYYSAIAMGMKVGCYGDIQYEFKFDCDVEFPL